MSEAFFEEAVVHDDFDAGGLGFGGGYLVDDTFLKPEVWNFEADDGVDDFGDMLGAAEDVDELDLAGMDGCCGVEIREGRLTER